MRLPATPRGLPKGGALVNGHAIRHQSLRDLFTSPDPTAADRDGGLGDELHDAAWHAHAAVTAHLTPSRDSDARNWAGADAYTRRTLAEHAAMCGRVDELVADPGFLLACQPESILRNRGHLHDPEGITAVNAFEAALGE